VEAVTGLPTPAAYTDIAGQPLAVGDRVATLMPRYRYTLATGTVVGFTPNGARVRLDGYNYSPRDPGWHSVGLAVVVKVPA
jgi:hypothetical protein